MNRIYSTLACLMPLMIVMSAGSLASADELWTENAKDAFAKAEKEKKDVLINFTGSDWCGWCKKLDKEVFSKDEFVSEASKSFVFLKLDFPRKRQLTDDVKKQNAELEKKYSVQGFPTILLADSSGKPYAVTGYQAGGPEAYLKHLAELRQGKEKRDAAMAKAAQAKDIDKAKLLDEALSALNLEAAVMLNYYNEQVAEIIKLDSDGKAGLKTKYVAMTAMCKIESVINDEKFDEAVTLADETIKTMGATGETAQMLFFMKAMAMAGKNDREGCKKALEDALKAAPNSKKTARIKQILEKLNSDNPK